MSPIIQGLIIAGIGMGLVFIAILALWGLMIVLVRITADRPKTVQTEEAAVETPVAAAVEAVPVSNKKALHLAAAAAVAIAMQMQQRPSQSQAQESNTISPWQVAHRASQLSRNTNRK